MSAPKILLSAWAATQYSPPPPVYTLRKWAREGQIYPPPERCGKHWYVDQHARRMTAQRPSVVERMQRERSKTQPQPA